ncbi:hypothetical protein AGRO_2557 [Agrobacterium sp. ATCC 31749]|nr:hypothetical protein AGRO_2557 [Agrobacterium sp. ATCC 31749]
MALVSAGSFGVAIRTGRGLMQGFAWQKLRFLTALASAVTGRRHG